MTTTAAVATGPEEIRVVLGISASLVRKAIWEAIEEELDMLVVAEESDVDGVVSVAGQLSPDVAVVQFDNAESIEACARLKVTRAAGRVLVVGMIEGPNELIAAVEAGADGYVSVDSELSDVTVAVRALAAGEAWIPPGMLGSLLGSLIRRRRTENAASERISRLSRREREVLAHLTEGMDQQRIADSLFLSPNTVRTHVQNVLQKLNVHSRLEAVNLAIESGAFEQAPRSQP